jgi:hypothetical protein
MLFQDLATKKIEQEKPLKISKTGRVGREIRSLNGIEKSRATERLKKSTSQKQHKKGRNHVVSAKSKTLP